MARVLAIGMAIAPMFAQFTPAPQTRMISVPLLDCSGMPCVDLGTGSGKTLRLLIDTGEVNAYLDLKAAQALGLDLQALKGSDGGDISQVQQTVVAGAHLGDLPLGDFPFMVWDTTPQPDQTDQKAQRLPADGALSYGAFKNRVLQIDSRNHVVRVSEPQAEAQPCPHDCSELVIKHVGAWGPVTLTAEGFAVNGKPVDVQLDTLFTGTMLIYAGSVEKLDLKKLSKAKPKEFFPFTQGGTTLARADAGAVSFRGLPLVENGPLYFAVRDARFSAMQFDATVGTGLLNRAIATFDFKGMHFWMDSTSAQ